MTKMDLLYFVAGLTLGLSITRPQPRPNIEVRATAPEDIRLTRILEEAIRARRYRG